MFKIETHAHTQYFSKCSKMDAATMVEDYLRAGYSGLVVTDHFNRLTYGLWGMDIAKEPDRKERFLEGYYRMKEEGQRQGLVVYKGVELRFDESGNDYLVYGFPEECYKDQDAIFQMGLAAFYQRFHNEQMLVIQAHPFRDGSSAADPRYLDGVEVQNMYPSCDSRNHLAKAFARENNHLLGISGSDCHRRETVACGGILTKVLPEDEAGLIALLRQKNFELLG